MIETGLIAARFVHYAALILLFGGFAYAGFAEGKSKLTRRFARLLIGSALSVVVGAGAVLTATVIGLGSNASAVFDQELWASILYETDFGMVWSVRIALACLAVLVALWWRMARSNAARGTGLLLVGGLLTTTAWTGHAAIEEGVVGQLHRWSNALHLIAAAVWIGALLPLAWLVNLGRAGGDAQQAARKLIDFHLIGIAAVVTLTVTGLINSYFLVGTPGRLVTTPYGRIVLLKLVLFAGMIGLAVRNHLSHTPALQAAIVTNSDRGPALTRLRRSIAGELLLGILVLAAVAVLGAIEPAAGL